MKKIFMTLCVALVTLSASAQKGENSIGVHALYGTDAGNIGFGVKYQNSITDAIRLEAVGDYYLKTDGFSMFDVNVNGHYLFPLSDKFTVYPLVGINYTSWKQESLIDYEFGEELNEWLGENANEKYDVDIKDSSIGLNIGGGIQYKLSDKVRIGAELKYQTISGASTAVIGAGVTFTL